MIFSFKPVEDALARSDLEILRMGQLEAVRLPTAFQPTSANEVRKTTILSTSVKS